MLKFRYLPMALAASLYLWDANCLGAQPSRRTASSTGPAPSVKQDSGNLLSLTYDEQAIALLSNAHSTGDPLELCGVPLPGGERVELLLQPTHVMPPGGSITIMEPDGQISHAEPTMRFFRGVVIGRGGQAFLGVDDSGISGRLEVDGIKYALSGAFGTPHERGIKRLEAFDADSNAAPGIVQCNTVDRQPQAAQGGAQALARDLPSASAKAPGVQVADVFLELSDLYLQLFSSNTEAINYALLMIGNTSEIFRRDLGLVLRVPSGYMRLWNVTPPWGIVGIDVKTFRQWWVSDANTLNDLPRSAVCLMNTGFQKGGQAFIAGACDDTESFLNLSLFGSFAPPLEHTSPNNADPFLSGHEFGHLFGSRHAGLYNPPIACNDGSGPDRGTLMGLCHRNLEWERVGMRLHERVQDRIRQVINATTCNQVIPIQLGDYDYDGDLDALDLSELDAYLSQGFASRGSEETFDMNADGFVDLVDRRLLASMVDAPEAFSQVRFPLRAGANNFEGFFSQSRPVLGRPWQSQVKTESPKQTFVFGSDRALIPGLARDAGDLLVALPGQGGTKLFLSMELSNGSEAAHSVDLPLDASLVGLHVFAQAAVIKEGTPHLSNAIELALGVR